MIIKMKSWLGCAVLLVYSVFLIGCSNGGGGVEGEAPLSDSQDLSITHVAALSNHYVELTFSGPAAEDVENPERYTIADSGGNLLAVTAARRVDEKTVILTTAAQDEVTYVLRTQEFGIRAVAMVDIPEISFVGSLQSEPYLSSAIAFSNTSVLLTFSKPMDKESVKTKEFYRIANPELEILDATLQAGDSTVLLTTANQINQVYTVRVTNVVSKSTSASPTRQFLIDPTASTASFFGLPPSDDANPRLIGAAATSDTSVLLSFSEPLSDDAASPLNFAIATGVAYNALKLDVGPDQTVTLLNGAVLAGVLTRNGFKVDPDIGSVISWTKVSGPGDVTFTPSDALSTDASFSTHGYYVLRSSIDDGIAKISDEITVGVSPDNSTIGTISHQETRTGASSDSMTVATTEMLTGVVDNLYLAAISLRKDGGSSDISALTDVTGLGLNWSLLKVQCAGRRLTRIEIWQATGSPAVVDGPVTATLAEIADHAVIAVTRYSGVDVAMPVDGVVATNSNGVDGECSGGSDDDDYALVQTTNVEAALVYAAVAARRTLSHTPGAGMTARGQIFRGGIESHSADLVIQDTVVAEPGSVVVEGKFNRATDWAAVTLELRATNRPPIVDAGIDQVLLVGASASLWGSVTDDTRLTPIQTEWSVVSGPGSVVFTEDTFHITKALFSQSGTYVLRMKADDGEHVATDELVVTAVSPTLVITDATMDTSKSQVLLTTLPQLAGEQYTVFALIEDRNRNGFIDDLDNEVEDLSGNAIDPNWSMASFRGLGADDLEQAPRVVSAGAISNTEVLVTFTEPVQGGLESAENPAHYRITASLQSGSIGPMAVVTIRDAELIEPDRTTVRLTTFSQSEVEYTLVVTNVRDLSGNPLAPPEGQDSVILPSVTTFVGIAPSGDEVIDTDGDGLSDTDEQFGWNVTVTKPSGETTTIQVTSDPTIADTDGDGVTDNEELHAVMDPRSPDTDGDTLTDNEEWNIILSDPTNQDTDGDGAQDGFEVFGMRTSPVLADTDGDQILDADEIFASNRNPRIADLPRSGIRVGEVRLQIDERFTFEDAQGTTVTVESSSSSSLSQSENTSYANSNTDVTEHVAGGRLETGFEGDEGGRGDLLKGGAFLNIEGSYQFTSSNSFTTDTATAIESQRVHEQSLAKAQEFNTTSTVTREVFGASIDVDVTIKNAGDLAFAISNLEITVLQRDRQSTNRFVPVATLVANRTLITGEPAVFNLGPFTPERGPILFSSRDVFPALVEELMKSPSGLIFKVANFDMTDEFGRVFTFANQAARDRTAGIIVDFGDSEAQQNLVSTSLQFDANNLTGQRFVGGYDAQTLPLGIPLDFALQDILNLTKNSTVVDGIVAGPNREAESIAQGDDVQLIPPGTTGVGVGSIVVSAGQNGILQSSPLGDDEAGVTTGYETSLTCDAASANARDICTADSDCTGGGLCSGPEILVRFNSHRNGDFNRVWAVLTTREIPSGADFGQVILKPGADIFFAFVQDLDQDGLFAREEYMTGSTDSRSDVFNNALFGESFDENLAASQVPDSLPDSRDTDRDGLGDFAEVRVGWKVSADGGLLRQVFSSPRLRDSDGDGLQDPVEQDLRRFCVTNDPRVDALCAYQSDPPVVIGDAVVIIAGPNGIADSLAVAGDVQLISPGVNGLTYATPVVGVGSVVGIQSNLLGDDLYDSLTNIPPTTDPSVGDTDFDTVSDFDELAGFDIGLSIRDGGNGVAETGANGDDVQKAFLNNPVKAGGIVILPGLNGTIDSTPGGDDTLTLVQQVVTDPLRRDTDADLVADGRELDQGGDPTDPFDGQDFRDSDQDGLTDSEEADLGWLVSVNGGAVFLVKSNPSLPDSDLDGLPDFIERDLRTNPNNADTDGDGLRDFDEFADFERYFGLEQQFPGFFVNGSTSAQHGTDPRFQDTDGDGLTDRFELLEGYRTLLAGEQEFRQIFTNPLVADTDFDGRTDSQEKNRLPPTDATDPDTDDDGRSDGQEQFVSDPLVRDVAIEIKMLRVIGSKVTGDGANGVAEMTWWFTTQGPSDTNPVLLTSPNVARPRGTNWTWGFPDGHGHSCSWYEMAQGFVYNVNLINSSRSVVLREGQSFTLNGVMGEIDAVSIDCGVAPYYIPNFLRDETGCVGSVNEIFTFNDFIGDPRGELKSAALTDACEFEVQYTIETK